MTQPPEFPQTGAYPEASQATTAVVLGVIGLFFQILGPVAWVIANGELKAIDSGLRAPENRSTANTARILGIIGTVLLVLGFLLVILALGFFTVTRSVSS
jgi:hypothetical protein